jgi:DNA ligase (NAD+)
MYPSLLGKILVSKEKTDVYLQNGQTESVPPGTILLIISETASEAKFILNNTPGYLPRSTGGVWGWTAVEAQDKLQGKTFVFTGALSNTREYFKTITELFGGKIGSTVSSSTDFLVSGDPTYMGNTNYASAKAKKAKALNVPVINEAQFRKMIR